MIVVLVFAYPNLQNIDQYNATTQIVINEGVSHNKSAVIETLED